jgi:hypothetical protein
VLVSTNLGIEIRRMATSRALGYGDLEWDIPLDDFFGVPANDVIVSDPHVMFDHEHDRFYATAVSATCSTGRLYVAVSSTDDARDAWTVYRFDFAGRLPDFDIPGFDSTTFAVSSNVFHWSSCTPGPFVGADLLVMDTSSLLASSSPIDWMEFGPDSGLFTIIPARDADGFSSSPLRLVVAMINGADLDVGYAEVSGSVVGGTINPRLSWTDLTAASGIELDPFQDPPQPHQPGSPTTISNAVDLRPTEAVWNGSFWFASTTACIPTNDTVVRACSRFVNLVGSGGSTAPAGEILLGEAGADLFDPGISANSVGPILTYARSSSSSPVGVLAAVVPDSNHIGTPGLLASGAGTTTGRVGATSQTWMALEAGLVTSRRFRTPKAVGPRMSGSSPHRQSARQTATCSSTAVGRAPSTARRTCPRYPRTAARPALPAPVFSSRTAHQPPAASSLKPDSSRMARP